MEQNSLGLRCCPGAINKIKKIKRRTSWKGEKKALEGEKETLKKDNLECANENTQLCNDLFQANGELKEIGKGHGFRGEEEEG